MAVSIHSPLAPAPVNHCLFWTFHMVESFNTQSLKSDSFLVQVYLCQNVCQCFIPFCSQIIFHCTDSQHFYLVTSSWAFGPSLFVTSSGAIRICKHVFGWTYLFMCSELMPSYRMAESCVKSICDLISCQTVFQSGSAVL